jgi:hypothetical protein
MNVLLFAALLALSPFVGLVVSWFLGLLETSWYPPVRRRESKPTWTAEIVSAETWFARPLTGGYVWVLRS